jgi:hypothetical protein
MALATLMMLGVHPILVLRADRAAAKPHAEPIGIPLLN